MIGNNQGMSALLLAAVLAAPAAPLIAQTDLLDVPALLASGRATVTHSEIDIGATVNIFDGNTNTLARSQSINPMIVTLSFDTPKSLARSRVWFLGGDSRCRVETADSVDDLDAAGGTFRIALDWTTGPHSTWLDRQFTTPTTCRAVRLKLQRLTGDDYVHLNDWQLFLLDRPFLVTDFRHAGPGSQMTWNSTFNQWYEVQTSPGFQSWTNAGFVKGLEDSTSFVSTANSGDDSFFRIRKAVPEDRPFVSRRVLVLNMDPILEAEGNQRLHQYLGWGDPHALTTAYLSDLGAASGGYVQWQVAAWVDLDHWPQLVDGFQYTDETYLQSRFDPEQYPWHTPNGADYDALLDLPLSGLSNRTAHEIAASGEVDEVIWWGGPYFGFFESRMVGSSAYACNSPPLTRTSRLYVVMGLNYERGVGDAVHSFGHRCEAILSHVYGSWSSTASIDHLWDRFTRVAALHGVSVAGCGNVHYPPNASDGYEYSVFAPVTSEADRWSGYPDFSRATVSVDASTWGGPDYQRNYLRWWLAHFPKARGRYSDPANAVNDGKLNNWWSYVVDMNEYAESR